MADSCKRSTSSTDSGDDLHTLPTSMILPVFVQLRDSLNSPPEMFIDYSTTTSAPTRNVSTPSATIINPDGSLDISKFTESMLRSNAAMSTLLSQSLTKPTNMNKLKEKRLLEDPPLLLATATYHDYVHWIDQMLIHFQ